mmetsp:Transcript_60962/g.181620  ORF Transcript_60962/g.181620 Transcript_60962/m.181620 type:complete len:175 (-) Transcript_60962:128-652(-)
MGHGYQHRVVKAELVNWLWDYDDEAFWQSLRAFVGKDWPAFANRVKGAWQQAGGSRGDLSFLDNKQHSVHVWQLVHAAKKPGRSKKDNQLRAKAELMDWLWYYENDQFWSELAASKRKGWKAFAAILKRAWASLGGKAGELNFLDNSQHCMDVYNVMFNGARPQLPRQLQSSSW